MRAICWLVLKLRFATWEPSCDLFWNLDLLHESHLVAGFETYICWRNAICWLVFKQICSMRDIWWPDFETHICWLFFKLRFSAWDPSDDWLWNIIFCRRAICWLVLKLCSLAGAPTKFCLQTGGFYRECDYCDAFNPEKGPHSGSNSTLIDQPGRIHY